MTRWRAYRAGVVAALWLAVLWAPAQADNVGIPAEAFQFTDPGVESNQAGALIHLSQAATKYPTITGQGYTIAVLDTGVDYTHPSLAGRNVQGYDFVNNDSDPDDDHGHGTHVTGIAVGADPTYRGIAPQARYAGLKVLNSSGSGTWDTIESGLKWVIDHRATYNIVSVNMSIGDRASYNSHVTSQISDELATLKDAGVFVAVASGNEWYSHQANQGVAYPAADASVVSVGAVWTGNFGSVSWSSGAKDYSTAADRITSFTDRSTTMLDIFAPGAIITNAAYNWEGTNPDFVQMAGTSMASPAVAGLSLLIRQAIEAQWPAWKRPTGAEWEDTILRIMRDSGTSIYDGDDENDNVTNLNASFRRIDALAALDMVAAMAAVPLPPALWGGLALMATLVALRFASRGRTHVETLAPSEQAA